LRQRHEQPQCPGGQTLHARDQACAKERSRRLPLFCRISHYALHEIAEHLARRLPEVNGVFIQMEDELGSLAAVLGASAAGTRAMTATQDRGSA